MVPQTLTTLGQEDAHASMVGQWRLPARLQVRGQGPASSSHPTWPPSLHASSERPSVVTAHALPLGWSASPGRFSISEQVTDGRVKGFSRGRKKTERADHLGALHGHSLPHSGHRGGRSPRKALQWVRFPSSGKPPSPRATGGFQEEMRLSSVICWGAWLGCGVPGSPTIRSAVLFEAFLPPISLREHSSSPLPFLKSLSTAQNLCTCLDMHVRSYKHAIRRADSVPLTNTPTRVHTLPHPLCDRRGRGLRRPLGGGQGVFIEAGSELMNFPGTRLLHPSGAKSGRPHGHPPGPEEGACRLCCQAGVGACECQLRGWGTLHLPAWPGAHSLLAWMPLPTRRNG